MKNGKNMSNVFLYSLFNKVCLVLIVRKLQLIGHCLKTPRHQAVFSFYSVSSSLT